MPGPATDGLVFFVPAREALNDTEIVRIMAAPFTARFPVSAGKRFVLGPEAIDWPAPGALVSPVVGRP
jgi:hypothetical protein